LVLACRWSLPPDLWRGPRPNGDRRHSAQRCGPTLADASVSLQHREGGTALTTVSDSDGKFRFSGVGAGACTLQAEAANYFKATYEFVLRPRQPISLNIELQPKETLRQEVEVQSNYLTIDPEKTGSSYTSRGRISTAARTPDREHQRFGQQSDARRQRQPRQFSSRPRNRIFLHEFVNGVSFLDNAQPQFSPGVSPQIFETVDLMTGGFTPNTATASAACWTSPRVPAPNLRDTAT